MLHEPRVAPLAVEDIVRLLQFVANERQEHFIVLTLDSKNRLIKKRTVFIGTLTSTIVHPREIFAAALEDYAASIVIAHNHPSGDPTPSREDVKTTQQLVAAGLIMGVKVADHIIVGREGHFSFMIEGLII